MKNKKNRISSSSDKYTVLTKIDFEKLDFVHDALFEAFHDVDNLSEEQQVDDRFVIFWHLFLKLSGWNEEDYWDEVDKHFESCEDCQQETEDLDKKFKPN